LNNIESGNDYARLLIDEILKDEDDAPLNKKMPILLLSFWINEIKILADETWRQYIIGKRDSYEFTPDEFDQTFNKAGLKYTEELLDGLVDKGVVEVRIGEKGDMLYGLTKEGIKIANNLTESYDKGN
jgi:hypothetical protein